MAVSSRRGGFFRWIFSGGKRKLQIECVGIWAKNKETWIATWKSKANSRKPKFALRTILIGKAHHFPRRFPWLVGGLRFP